MSNFSSLEISASLFKALSSILRHTSKFQIEKGADY